MNFLQSLPEEIRFLVFAIIAIVVLLFAVSKIFGDRLKKVSIEIGKEKIGLSIETFLKNNNIEFLEINKPTDGQKSLKEQDSVFFALHATASELKRIASLLRTISGVTITKSLLNIEGDIVFPNFRSIKLIKKDGNMPIDLYCRSDFDSPIIIKYPDGTIASSQELLIVCENTDGWLRTDLISGKKFYDTEKINEFQNNVLALSKTFANSFYWVILLGTSFAATCSPATALSLGLPAELKSQFRITSMDNVLETSNKTMQYLRQFISTFSSNKVIVSNEFDIGEIEKLAQENANKIEKKRKLENLAKSLYKDS